VPEPIAFMVMPFGRKPTGLSEAEVPAEVDFDALWFDVYRCFRDSGTGRYGPTQRWDR
jgi:hypothetical protein